MSQQNLIQIQNDEYQKGLDEDQLKENQNTIKRLQEVIAVREENNRCKRLSLLNSLTPKRRRLFMMGELNVDLDGNDEQRFYNVSNDVADSIDPEYMLIYEVTDDLEVAFSLKDLFARGHVKMCGDTLNYIELPITVGDDLCYFYVAPRYDTQWEYTVISAQLTQLTQKPHLNINWDEYLIDDDGHDDAHSDSNQDEHSVSGDDEAATSANEGNEVNEGNEIHASPTGHTGHTGQTVQMLFRERLQMYGIDPSLIDTAISTISSEEAIHNLMNSGSSSEEEILERFIETFFQTYSG